MCACAWSISLNNHRIETGETMPTELTSDEHIKVLQHEVEELKKQVFVLTDKSNQTLIAAESNNAC
jgi:hypothetical protein